MSGFEHRGVIEGFYGTPFAHEDRLWLLERMGAWGLNRYVYAPKDDPLHLSEWRTPYPPSELARFAELVSFGREREISVGFAVSPGLSISYASNEDRRALFAKFAAFRELGARFFSLALDDTRSSWVHEADAQAFPTLAHAHAALANELAAELGDDATLWLVPLDYVGVEPTEYLHVLGSELEPRIEVAWTGRTVVSPTIAVEEAAVRARTLGRKLLLWDNVPVNDGPMRGLLHLGPYGGRAAGLGAHVSGALLNPMIQPRASGVALRTAAAFLRDPDAYDPEEAWAEALEELGAGDPAAFHTFALAHRFSALWPDVRDRELETGFARLAADIEEGQDVSSALDELRARIEVRTGVAERLRKRLRDRRLALELEPWLASHERETRRLDAAMSAAQQMLAETSARDRVMAFLAMEGRLTREGDTGKTSYGPRRAMYPQLASLRDEEMSLADDPVLFRGRCLTDEFVEFVEDLALWLLARRR